MLRSKNILGAFSVMLMGLSLGAMEEATIEIHDNSNPYEKQTAQEKSDLIWSNIVKGEYSSFPPFKGPGWGIFDLMSANYVAGAYDSGDFMENGREKHIHGSGVIMKVAFIVNEQSKLRYSGLFNTGSEFAYLRISLAVPAESDKCVPALAIKFLRDGRASENIMAMFSLEGQPDANIFANDFTTIVPEPAFSFKTWLLEKRFSAGLDTLGKGELNTRAFSLDAMASAGAQGQKHIPKAPDMLIFRPTKAAKKLLAGITFADDFRALLYGKGKHEVLYEVYARATETSDEQLIGSIQGSSHFKASKYADEMLRFQHPMMQQAVPSESLCPFFGTR